MLTQCTEIVCFCLPSAAKTAYSLLFEQQWHVTIFHHFMTKLKSFVPQLQTAFTGTSGLVFAFSIATIAHSHY